MSRSLFSLKCFACIFSVSAKTVQVVQLCYYYSIIVAFLRFFGIVCESIFIFALTQNLSWACAPVPRVPFKVTAYLSFVHS